MDKAKSLQVQINEIELDRDQGLAIEKEKLTQDLGSSRAELEKLRKETEIILLDTKVNKEQELTFKEASLNKELESLNVNKDALAALEVVQSPFSSIKPVKPKKINIVGLALVLGIMVAVMAGLFTGFLVKNKAKMV